LPDTAVKEARERMRMAFKNCGVKLPPKKIVINLAPSDVKKEGTKFDLAMATAILLLTVSISKEQQSFFEDTLCFGELGLDGSVRKVQGLLPCIVSAYRQ
jgi:magnesium chelatase family protein